MSSRGSNITLVVAAVLTLLLALIQVAKILGGLPVYRRFGVDETLIQMTEAGSSTPTMLFGVFALLLFILACYALSGAGVVRKLPMLRSVLMVVGLGYLFAGIAPWIIDTAQPPDQAMPYLSSGFYIITGLLHIIGTILAWEDIYYRPKAW